MKKFLMCLAPMAVLLAFALAPGAAQAAEKAACTKYVLCPSTNNEAALRDDLLEPPEGGSFGTDGLAVNTQGPLRLCKEVSAGACAGVNNMNPVNDAFFGIKLHEDRLAPVTTKEKEECKEAAGHEAAATGWVEWADIQDATSTGGTASAVYAGTSPGDNGAWSLSVRSNLCTTNPGRVSIDKFALYLTFPKWVATTPSTGEIVGKYVNPTTPCAGGGVELNIEQTLEINDVSGTRAIDNGSGGKAILCFVSANNYLYPEKGPVWEKLIGGIWKD
ncbi:MAG: hypothetical protein ACLQMH_08735 [Solirubrobacteraceae bacterium]